MARYKGFNNNFYKLVRMYIIFMLTLIIKNIIIWIEIDYLKKGGGTKTTIRCTVRVDFGTLSWRIVVVNLKDEGVSLSVNDYLAVEL